MIASCARRTSSAGMPHSARPNTDDVLAHDLARVDLDAAAIADHDDASAGRDDGEVVIEIDVGEHFENHVGTAPAGERGDLVEIAGALVIDGVPRALRPHHRQSIV